MCSSISTSENRDNAQSGCRDQLIAALEKAGLPENIVRYGYGAWTDDTIRFTRGGALVVFRTRNDYMIGSNSTRWRGVQMWCMRAPSAEEADDASRWLNAYGDKPTNDLPDIDAHIELTSRFGIFELEEFWMEFWMKGGLEDTLVQKFLERAQQYARSYEEVRPDA